MPSFLPNEPHTALVTERYLFQGFVLGQVMYGIAFILAILCLQQLWQRRTLDPLRRTIFIVYVALLLCCSTLAAGGVCTILQEAWIDDRDAPGGPLEIAIGGFSSPATGVGVFAYVIATYLADGMMVSAIIILHLTRTLI
jgi:hypothetical protein